MNIEPELRDRLSSLFEMDLRAIPSIEEERQLLINQVCCHMLQEFNIDFDDIVKVQINQNITGDSDMIPNINLVAAINSLIPNVKMGLFDFLSPSVKFTYQFLSSCVEYYEFCDTVLSHINTNYPPYVQALNAKQIQSRTANLHRSINDLQQQTNNEAHRRAEAENLLSEKKKRLQDETHQRFAIQHSIEKESMELEAKHKKRRDLQSELTKKKQRVEKMKWKLALKNRDQDGSRELVQTRERIARVREDAQAQASARESLRQVSTTLAQRIHSVHLISSCAQQIELAEKRKEDLSHFKKELDGKTDEMEALVEQVTAKNKHIDALKESVSKLKGQSKDYSTFDNKIEELRKKKISISESYQREENRSIEREKKLVEVWKKKMKILKEKSNEVCDMMEKL